MKTLSGALAVLIVLVAPSSAFSGGEVDVQVDFASRYIWRGFDVFHDNVSALQPDITFYLGDSGFSLDVWSSFALAQRERLKELDEVDITLAYDVPLVRGVDVQAGMIHYAWFFEPEFSLRDSTSLEMFLGASFPGVWLTPSLTVFYDIHQGSGIYIQAQGSKTWSLSPGLALELSGSLGYNGRQWIEESGFSDLQLGLALPLSWNGVRLSLFVNWAFIFMESVNADNEFWVGFSLGSSL